MKRALIIKGTDFSQNKLKTVVFIKPCTGIELDEDTFELNSYSTAIVTYTLTPSDTTDDVEWASSDTSIVTVADGVITPVGVGTATITATCGEITAAVEVSVTFSYIPNWCQGMIMYSSTNETVSYSSSNYRLFTAGTDVQATNYNIYTDPNQTKAVKLPPNTGTVKIKTTDSTKFQNSEEAQIVWAKNEASPNVANCVHGLSAEDKYNIRTYPEKTYEVPNGADSFAFTCYTGVLPSETTPNEYVESAGLTIEFLPADE